ncbi:MAG: hypothetical protein JW839_19070 [Candidatus Lokiarchaeota archaeon]|nr:hypothetical protein [Candidatus Lokiarchaeota archaeon]
MLIQEIFGLTAQLACTVQQRSHLDKTETITREYIERVADDDVAIKNHVARETIVDRVFFDV